MRGLPERLVDAPPPVVSGHAHARGEGPLWAGGPGLRGCHVMDPTNQGWVARSAQTDVVREHRGAVHVAVAVHRVNAVDEGDVQPGLERGCLVTVNHVRPGARPVRRWHGPATGQQAAKVVAGDL